MKKRVLSLFLAITLCLTLTPTGALAEDVQPPEQTVSATQEAQIPAPALEEKEEEKTAPAENGADENASPASPDEKPTENTPAAPEKNPADEEPGKEPAAATGRDESKADGSPSDDDAAKVQNQLVMAAAAGPDEPTMMGQNNFLTLDDAEQNAAGGGFYVAPGSPTEGGGGTYISGEDTRTEIWCVSKPDSIGRSYDGTTDGGTIPIDLTFTDGTNEIKLKEGTGFTAKKTFDSADAGWHTVTVEIALIGEAAVKYKLKAGEEKFTIGGNINKAYPKLTVSLSKAACTVGEKILPLLSVSGVQDNAAVTYYYTQYKSIVGDSDYEGNVIPAIDENTAISEPGTYYVYAKTAETKNYKEERSTTAELTVNEAVVEAASVTKADGKDGGTYTTLPAALNAAQDGDTVKLLADHTTIWGDVEAGEYATLAVVKKTLTLDLNGMTVDYLTVGDVVPDEAGGILESYDGNLTVVDNAQGGSCGKIKDLEFVKGSLTIQGGRIGGSLTCDGNSGTVTISGGTVCYVTVGDGATVTVTGGTGHAGTWCNDGTLNITDGTFGNVNFLNNGGTIAISGGTFGTITNINGSGSIPLMPLLADNYAFYQGDNAQNSTETTLTNVTVRPHTHTFENGKCDCGASYVASVTTSNGVTNNYTSLDDALDAAQDGDTVTLIGDAEVTKTHQLRTPFTLELNGKTATVQKGAPLIIRARIVIQDSSTEKTGNMVCTDSGTHMLNVQNGDLSIKSGTFAGKIAAFAGGESKLTIDGGTFTKEVNLGTQDAVSLSGGTFTQICHMGSFLDLLADGYAFYDKDNKLVNAAKINSSLWNASVRTHQHSFTDGACGCGYTCPHTSVNENGVCEICNKQFAASITEGNDVTYYDTFGSALVYAFNNDGCTLKLLADVTGTTVMINNPFIFDLNGHSVDALSVEAKATIKDSGTTKGRIGKVTVFNEKVPDLTLGSLLEEGYAFRDANDEWIDVAGKEAQAVSVQKAPIQSLTIKTDKTTYTPDEMITLTATAQMSGSETVTSYQWTYDGMAMEQNPAGSSLQANQTQRKARGGTHTFTCIAYCGGYTFTSQPYTITVEPIDLSGATVSVKDYTYTGTEQCPKDYTVAVTLNGKTVSYNYYDVVAEKQTNAGSYTLTVTGKGDYKGTIENVPWKIKPAALTVSAPSEVKKAYDGTTNATVTPIFNGLQGGENLTAADYSVTAAFDNANVGYYKTVTGTVTLKQTDTAKNYVLRDAGKFSTDNGTIAKAVAPTVQPVELTIYNGVQKVYFVDLPSLPPLDEGKSYGTVGYRKTHTINLSERYIAQSELGADPENLNTLRLLLHMTQTGSLTGEIGAVTIPVTTSNYQDINLTVKVNAVNQIKPEPDGTITATPITYGNELSKSTISGKMKDPTTGDEVKGTFAWTDGTIKPAASDNYEAEWTFTPAAGYEKYATATGTVTVKVNKATPTFTAPTAQENLTYTGQEQALITAGMTDHGTIKYSLTENGTYSQDIPTGTDAGAYTVWYRVIGDANHNDTAPASVAVRIGKKPLTITGVTAASKPYDGTTDAGITSVTFDGVNLNRDTDYNVTANFDDAGVGKSKNVTATVTLMGQTAKNYFLEQSSFPTTGSITKAAAPGSDFHPAVTVINDLAKTYEMLLTDSYLPKLSSPCGYGNVSYSLRGTYLTDGYKDTVQAEVVEENSQYKLKLTVPAVDYDKISSVGTIDVRVTSDNYQDFYLTIGVKTKNKDVPVPDGTISASNITYGQALNDSKITGKMKDNGKTIDGTFAWKNGAINPDAGSYDAEWVFTPAEGYEEYATATGTATVTVNRKAVTVSGITARNKVYDGKANATLDCSTAKLDGVLENDTLTVTATGTFESADVGEQKVIISGFKLDGDSAANYVPATKGSQTETTATITAKEVTVAITPNGGTYGSVTAAAATLSGAVDGETVPVTLTYTGNGYNSTSVPTDVGSYTVTASIADSNYVLTGKTTANFVIEPKSIKGAKVVLGKALTANGAEQTQTVEKVLLDGKELPADSYTVTGNTATAPGRHTLTITARGNYTGTVDQTYVIVPAKAEDAPGEDITIGSGKVKVDVQSEGTVPPATLLTDKAELLAMLVNSGDITADELVQIANGASVDIVLTVKEANVSDEVKTAMAQAAKDYTIGQYLDISLLKYMTVNGSQQAAVALPTTKDALTISVAVPDALINTNSAVNRTYCIVRNHDGAITVLDAAFDAASKTLTFKTDRFSDYAIAYKDTAVPGSGSNPGSNNSSNDSETKKNEVAAPTPAPTPASTSKPSTITAMPQTGDTSNPTLYVVLLVASLLGLAVVFVCKKRNDK